MQSRDVKSISLYNGTTQKDEVLLLTEENVTTVIVGRISLITFRAIAVALDT